MKREEVGDRTEAGLSSAPQEGASLRWLRVGGCKAWGGCRTSLLALQQASVDVPFGAGKKVEDHRSPSGLTGGQEGYPLLDIYDGSDI